MSTVNREHLLTVAARAIFANFSMTLVVIGVHVFMALYGLSVFLETPKPLRKGRKRYIAVSFAITVLSALTASLDMAQSFQMLFNSTSATHWQELMRANLEDWKNLTGYAALGSVTFIGNTLLVYRCYIICVEFWWITILPLLMSVSALVLFFVGNYDHNLPSGIGARFFTAATFLTVSTNIIVTGLITFRLLHARKTLAALLPSSDVRLYTGVIAILIESATPLTICGIIQATLKRLTLRTLPFVVGTYLFDFLFYSFCSLSPHMIIFRVTTGRSFTKFPTSKDAMPSNPIHFAHQTTQSSSLQSTQNRAFCEDREIDVEKGFNVGAIQDETAK